MFTVSEGISGFMSVNKILSKRSDTVTGTTQVICKQQMGMNRRVCLSGTSVLMHTRGWREVSLHPL